MGRIYQMHSERWFWGVNALVVDSTVGGGMHGYAESLDDAKTKLRSAFERWLVWALAIPQTDLKYPNIAEELEKIGCR